MNALALTPVTRDQAMAFIRERHRHSRRPQGYRFAIGIERDGQLVGVATAGRPVARCLDDGRTIEVTRVCTDGTPNACSMLYGACWRTAKAMGYRRAITYTLCTEPGTSLRAAGWVRVAELPARPGWNMPSRPRETNGGELGEQLSAGRRLTLRQAADLARGVHPLTGGPLHPDAAPAGDRSAPGTRCGSCRFRVVGGYGRSYPKCHWPNAKEFLIAKLPRVTHGPATDCRQWWPACSDWQPREEA